MKISANYRRILETYLEWERVRTPASGMFEESAKSQPCVYIDRDYSGLSSDGLAPEIDSSLRNLSAAEALHVWESQGKPCTVRESDYDLFVRYAHGKSQRDWWSREIGWLNKHAVYIPEEFLGLLGPLPFIELFGRGPRTRLVRHFFDNRYSAWEFNLDCAMSRLKIRWNMAYYERDDRDSALTDAWRMIRVK